MPSARVEIHDQITHGLIEVLENAYRIGYEKAANMAPIAWFNLPRDDPKWSAVQSFREVWLYDELNLLVDVFRVMPSQEQHDESGATAAVKCEGYATVLQDDLVPAEIIYTNQTAAAIFADLLSYQSLPRVIMGTIDSGILITYRVSYANVMKACWEVRNIVGGYISIDPQPGNPAVRQLFLRQTPGRDIGQRAQKGWNLRSVGKATDPSAAVTKLYPLGRGEGNNQQKPSTDFLTTQAATFAASSGRSTVTITDPYSRYKGWTAPGAALPTGVTAFDTRVRPLKVWFGGVDDTTNWEQGADERTLRSKVSGYTPPAGGVALDYVHADYLIADDTVGTYGVISRPYPDKQFEGSLDLIRAARTALAVVKLPRVSYDVKVADLARNYPGEPLEQLALYDQIVVTDDVIGVATKLRIVKVRYDDLWDPNSFAITVGLLDAIPTDVQLQDRARQYATMPDGATNIWVDSFEDNVDATHPYSRDIYIPADAVNVNKLTVNLRTKAYRYYVSAGSSSSASAGHVHFLNFAATVTGTTSAHNHAIANEAQSFTQSESPAHTHVITTTLTPGIVETTTPSAMEVKVDGTVASATAATLTDFDISPYLTKDSNGRIARGWHTLTFTPNANGRIQAAIVEVVFLQSRGVVAG